MFIPLLEPPDTASGPPLVFAIRGTAVHVRDGAAAPLAVTNGVFLGLLDDRPCWAADIDGDTSADELLDELAALDPEEFRDLRRLWGALDETVWTIAGRAVQLVEWSRTHRFCGRCGEATEPAGGERAVRCPACGLMGFPRLAPAVITLVEREDGRALLARGRQFPMAMYSCLAGFVEPGETLEHAVAREVREEVGIAVDAVTYWGSQPWPFPHSLMIGFTCRYAGGDLVLDEREIADANWFRPDELPMVPPAMSIARRLIDDWIERRG